MKRMETRAVSPEAMSQRVHSPLSEWRAELERYQQTTLELQNRWRNVLSPLLEHLEHSPEHEHIARDPEAEAGYYETLRTALGEVVPNIVSSGGTHTEELRSFLIEVAGLDEPGEDTGGCDMDELDVVLSRLHNNGTIAISYEDDGHELREYVHAPPTHGEE